jgi:hypothetical protein
VAVVSAQVFILFGPNPWEEVEELKAEGGG